MSELPEIVYPPADPDGWNDPFGPVDDISGLENP